MTFYVDRIERVTNDDGDPVTEIIAHAIHNWPQARRVVQALTDAGYHIVRGERGTETRTGMGERFDRVKLQRTVVRGEWQVIDE